MAELKFIPPKSVRSMVEEKAAESDEFELMVTFRKEGEYWCAIKIEDVDLEYDKDKKKGGMVDAYRKSRESANAPQYE